MGYELRHVEVIDRLGAGRLARSLRLPRSTVYSWRKAGVIPAKYHPAILQAASGMGLDVSASDFIGAVNGNAALNVAAGDYAQN